MPWELEKDLQLELLKQMFHCWTFVLIIIHQKNHKRLKAPKSYLKTYIDHYFQPIPSASGVTFGCRLIHTSYDT